IFDAGFLVPRILLDIFLIPAASTTTLTAPPAITPDPSGAGFRRTLAAPRLTNISWGIVPRVRGTVIRFFLAKLTHFLIEEATSLALPRPRPTLPFLSPTTTITDRKSTRLNSSH